MAEYNKTTIEKIQEFLRDHLEELFAIVFVSVILILMLVASISTIVDISNRNTCASEYGDLTSIEDVPLKCRGYFE